MIKLFTTVLVLACIALPAASIENVPIKTVTHKNITVFQPFLWTQDGFRVRINGDVTCCVDAYCCTNPVPDSITVEYAGGITTITWYGTYPQDIDSTDGRPHFGFDIENSAGPWNIIDQGWFDNSSTSLVPIWGSIDVVESEIGIFVRVTNNSTESIRMNTGGYMDTTTAVDIDDLGLPALPPSSFSTFATNVVVLADSSETFYIGPSVLSHGVVYSDLEWASGSMAYTTTVQAWSGLSPVPTAVPTLSEWALIVLLGGLALGGAWIIFRQNVG